MRIAVPWLCLCVVLKGATGVTEPQLSAFDDLMNSLLTKWRIPGAAIGVSHNGRLVLARGYGVADGDAGQQVQPDSLFRIAGISKTITAVALLRLAEDGKLSLDDKTIALLAGSDSAALGRMTEKASSQSFESYVKSAVLMPLGISHMQIGDAALEGSSGWMASVIDLLRFANALDGRRPPMLLKPATLQAMIARPPASTGAPTYTGLGWIIQPAGADANWWSSSGGPGASAYLFRQAATGVDVALLFNSRPSDGAGFDADVAGGVTKTANSVRQWPSTDLFVSGPELFERDVINAADRSSGRVAPGEIVVLFPSNAGPAVLAGSQLDTDGRAATSTGDTRVLFDGIPAPMASAVRGQVGAVVPYGIANRRTTQVVVEYQGVRSPPVTLAVVDTAPALFTLDESGKGQAAILNETGCCNAPRNPAKRGSVVALYATGEGQTTPPGIDGDVSGNGPIADLPVPRLPVRVTVGGEPAEIVFAGKAPHATAGLLQVNFRVPANAPLGDAVPLVLKVGNATSRDGVTMAVRPSVQRVLVLDSDAVIRNRLTGILKGAGYEVSPARDSREALAQAKQYPVDMVICSLAMPEAELLNTIRAIGSERRQLRIIATAGLLGPTTLRSADLLGAQAVLKKPLVAETVLRRVRDLLQARPVPYVVGEEAASSPLR